jgi:hypothetical protein
MPKETGTARMEAVKKESCFWERFFVETMVLS